MKVRSFIVAAFLVISVLFCGCNQSTSSNSSTTSNVISETVETTTQTATTTASTTQNITTEPTIATKPQTQSNSNDKVEKLLNNMSVEEKVGQMFYVRCPDENAAEKVSKYHLGGYILFSKDFDNKTKTEIVSDINSYQKQAKIPMLIGVDEEGGTVVRVSSNENLRSTPFLSPWNTYLKGGFDAIKKDAKEKADLLLSLGINVNMAPDCDITSDPNAFMYYRSFSSDTQLDCKFVNIVVETEKNNKLGTVLKHFPGYGNNEDTHTGIAYDNRAYKDFEKSDFKPFESGIASGADCVLVSHNIVSCMDSSYPASLSTKVHNILRDELHFDRVIMTDDLYMDAIRNYTGDSKAAVIAAKCGNDILCCTDFETQYPAVLDAVKNGDISIDSVNESVRRILNWKQDLGLI